MKTCSSILLLLMFVGCATSEEQAQLPPEVNKKYPAVTIETSGDLYYEEGGNNIQMDLFGNCAPGKSVIYIEVDAKKSVAQCQKGRYRYSLNLPKTFFQKEFGKMRNPSSKYVMKEVSAYHSGHKKLNATSYILIDRKKKEVKSVINKQVKFEKIPTGEYEPITQYNAFGGCTPGSVLKLDITAPDRYGHEASKYDETKKCQKSGGYYFLSQVHGYPRNGTLFYVYEDIKVESPRNPASQAKPKYKNLLKWSVPIK
jgi:hypothetical protein